MSLHFFSAAFRARDEADRQHATAMLGPIAPDDPVLQGLLEEVRTVLRTPIAMLTIVDGDVQHIAGALGFEPMDMHRAVAICPHTMATADGMLSVPDLRADARFAANPLVTHGPRMRHYTGVVVRSGPFAVGALCGLDPRPRGPASFRQRAQLRRLAEAVARHIGAAPRQD